jgi:hypothetical protein
MIFTRHDSRGGAARLRHVLPIRHGAKFSKALVIAAAGTLALAGCKATNSGKSSGIVTTPATAVTAPTPTPTPSPTPSPTPTMAAGVAASAAEALSMQLSQVASNFDRLPLLDRTCVLTRPLAECIPASSAPDVGAFRFVCNPSHELKDDPLVYPGQPGRSHLHQFFGNTLANANSTYESLRTTGESTCTNKLNRSAYWIPAMLDGKGKVVRPDYNVVYYKRWPKNSPHCTEVAIACVQLPRGLRYIFGFDTNKPTADRQFSFTCTGPTGNYQSKADLVSAAAGCGAGNQIEMTVIAPNCWDGKNLDSPNHRDHMAYPSYGYWGYLKCPPTHPFLIPTFQLNVFYTVDDNLDRSGQWPLAAGKTTWSLASDSMPGMTPSKPGTTAHADWFGAWDDATLQAWTDNCIDGNRNCSSGVLGDGTMMKERADFTWSASPRLVPVPN